MRLQALVLPFFLALLMAPDALAGRRRSKPAPDSWKDVDGNLAFRAMEDRNQCAVHILNKTKRRMQFVEFEYTWINRAGVSMTLRQQTMDLAPRTWFFGETWMADTTDCAHVTMRVKTIRYAD